MSCDPDMHCLSLLQGPIKPYINFNQLSQYSSLCKQILTWPCHREMQFTLEYHIAPPFHLGLIVIFRNMMYNDSASTFVLHLSPNLFMSVTSRA